MNCMRKRDTYVFRPLHERVPRVTRRCSAKCYGIFGNLLQSGLRFSRNALPPSCASSVM